MTALPHEAPSVTGCAFVVERAREGACEFVKGDRACGADPFIDRAQFDLPPYETHDADWVAHPCTKGLPCSWQDGHDGECAVVTVASPIIPAYLGPVEATCGHPESEHGVWLLDTIVDHAFTEAP